MPLLREERWGQVGLTLDPDLEKRQGCDRKTGKGLSGRGPCMGKTLEGGQWGQSALDNGRDPGEAQVEGAYGSHCGGRNWGLRNQPSDEWGLWSWQ